ncbi:MAG: hypothetical protein RMK18_08050 [Armatimonadota bacterium]|nr:hypothetical protein [Armatimonadota bacterium]MCX7776723.1 hypothetical protein [Armatimonadota bacterium]MDW8025792.1 hypothetical protein [Armatimonadota bacterium]
MRKPITLEGVKPISIRQRKNKVNIAQLARQLASGASFSQFFESLPRILAGSWLRELVDAICKARIDRKQVLVMYGAHVVKCGLSPILIQLMKGGVITALATNGAGAYHDIELAIFGETSEDVSEGILSGTFGMAAESANFINHAARLAARRDNGLGETIGAQLIKAKAKHADLSILAQAYKLGIPLTVHVAIGTDVNHMHPSFDAASWGKATYNDFRIICGIVSELSGGVVLNFGSAVILPLIFEKALALVRNMGHDVKGFVGATFDFIRHYRATNNPVQRAEELGGKGFYIIGHHELLIPLLAQALLERMPD